MSGTTTQNVVQTNIPAFLEPYAKNMMDQAGVLYSTDPSVNPYVPYDGQRISDFTPLQQQAFTMSGTLPDGYQSDFDAARQGAGALSQFGANVRRGNLYDPTDFENELFTQEQYDAAMNPYLGNVLDRAQSRATDRFADQQMLRDQQAARTGSFGGSRRFVADSMAQRDFNDTLEDMEATQLSNAFTNAQGFLTGQRQLGEASKQFDVGTRLRGGDMIGMASNLALNTGTSQGKADLSSIDAMLKTGGLQQQLGQRGLDTALGDFQRQQNWQRDNLNSYSTILRGLPTASNSTSTQTTTPGNPSTMNQLIGGATALYPLVSRLFG